MAIAYSISSTETSITLTLSGFSTINGPREFYFYADSRELYVDEDVTVPGNQSVVSYTFTDLTPGTLFEFGAEMTSPNGNTFTYGPYSLSTKGTSPYEVTGSPSVWFTSGTTIYVRFNGLNKVSAARQVSIGYRKSSESKLTWKNWTIAANSTNSSPYYYLTGLEEKTAYNLSVELLYDGEVLGEWTLSAETGYADGGSMSAGSVTEKGCTLTVSGIPGTAKYPRTLYWYGREGTSGEWELLTTTTATSEAAQTHSRNDLQPMTYYEFKVSVYAGGEFVEDITTSCTTSSASGNLTASESTEYSVKLTLSGLATGVSYARRIKWYYKAAADSAYTQFSDISSVAQSSSSASMVIDTLASDTSYSFKAEICDNSGTVLGTKTATATTKETVAEVSTGSITSASIKVIISGLANVAYTRTFEWLYKRQDETDYVKFDETEMLASDSGGEMTKVFKPLIASTHYNFKVYIKKEGLAMKELTISARTALDNSLVPDTEIERIEQNIGSTTVKVFWDAPEHDAGAYYRLQYSTDDENFMDIGDVMTDPPADGSYTEVNLPALDTEYYIQVMSYFEVDGEIASKFSASLPIYTFSVLSWDTEKSAGMPFNLTADEWNKVVKVVKERLEYEDVIPEEFRIDLAVAGRNFTAEHFNQMLRAVKVFNPNEIDPVESGGAVTAQLLNQLIAKVNLE